MFSRELYPNYLYLGVNCDGLNIKIPIKESVHANASTFAGGVNIGYEYLKPSFIYAGLDLMINMSHSSLALKEGNITATPDSEGDIISGELRLGYTIGRGNWLLTPCAGVGVYCIGSLERISMSLDIPYGLLGLRLLYQKSPLFDMGLNITVYGEFHKKLSCDVFDEYYPIMGLSEWGGSLALPLIWHVDETRRWDLRLEPFITTFSFSQIELLYGAIFMAGYHF